MVKLIVLFPQRDAYRPDYEARYNDFLIKIDHLPGMRRKVVCNVYAGPGGPAAYHAVVEAFFDDGAALQAALTSPAGIEAGQALLDFAEPGAVTLFSEVMEENYPPT